MPKVQSSKRFKNLTNLWQEKKKSANKHYEWKRDISIVAVKLKTYLEYTINFVTQYLKT